MQTFFFRLMMEYAAGSARKGGGEEEEKKELHAFYWRRWSLHCPVACRDGRGSEGKRGEAVLGGRVTGTIGVGRSLIYGCSPRHKRDNS